MQNLNDYYRFIATRIVNGHKESEFALGIEKRVDEARKQDAIFVGLLVFTRDAKDSWRCKHLLNGWGTFVDETFYCETDKPEDLKHELLMHLRDKKRRIEEFMARVEAEK